MAPAEAAITASGCSDLLRGFLDGTEKDEVRRRRVYGRLPSNPRCLLCYAPFAGPGATLMRMRGRQPFAKNPRVCNVCFRAMTPGGCETDIVALFLDLRGSTQLAERLGSSAFARELDRFYEVATTAMVDKQAFVELTGDEVYAFYVPALTPGNAARVAVDTAEQVIRQLAPLRVGGGIHAGPAWVGVVGDERRIKDFRSIGDTVNVGARLVAAAESGECLVSEAAYKMSGLQREDLEERTLALKGKAEPFQVRVLGIGPREETIGIQQGD